MASVENICRLLDSLPASCEQLAVLQEVKLIIFSLQPSELKQVVPNISFNGIFDCLNTNDNDLLEVSCDVLVRLLSVLSPQAIFQNFQLEMKRGLSHPLKPVKLLALSMLLRCAEDNPAELSTSEDLLLSTAALLGEDALDVAKEANKVLVQLGKNKEGLITLYHGPVFNKLQEILEKNDTTRYRVFQFVVDVCKLSPLGLIQSSQSGLLTQAVNDLYKNDILVQLNCLELLKDLASVEHGLDYLDKQGIVSKLESMMGKMNEDPMGTLLLPGLIKVFGNIARLHPKEVFDKHPTFMSMVFDLLSSSDLILRSVAVESLGFVSAHMEGKQALEKLGDTVDKAVRQLGIIIKDSPTEIRIKALHAFSSLIRLEVADQTSELLTFTEHLFQKVAPRPFDLFLSISKQPFPELRCAAHQTYVSLALQPWGQKQMNNWPGFNEYLLDRTTELEKEGKEAKFEVIHTLAESPTTVEIFGRPFYIKLKEYVNQGPYYVKAQAEVAFEGST